MPDRNKSSRLSNFLTDSYRDNGLLFTIGHVVMFSIIGGFPLYLMVGNLVLSLAVKASKHGLLPHMPLSGIGGGVQHVTSRYLSKDKSALEMNGTIMFGVSALSVGMGLFGGISAPLWQWGLPAVGGLLFGAANVKKAYELFPNERPERTGFGRLYHSSMAMLGPSEITAALGAVAYNLVAGSWALLSLVALVPANMLAMSMKNGQKSFMDRLLGASRPTLSDAGMSRYLSIGSAIPVVLTAFLTGNVNAVHIFVMNICASIANIRFGISCDAEYRKDSDVKRDFADNNNDDGPDITGGDEYVPPSPSTRLGADVDRASASPSTPHVSSEFNRDPSADDRSGGALRVTPDDGLDDDGLEPDELKR